MKQIYSLLVLGALLLTSQPAVANLISDGNFASPNVPTSGTAYSTFNAGQTFGGAWNVTNGSIDVIANGGNGWQAAPGGIGENVDMDGSTYQAGTINQSFATTTGAQYDLTFYLPGNPGGLPTIKTLEVLAGTADDTFTFNITGLSASNMGWTQEQVLFTAIGSETTLTFESLDPGSDANWGPAIGDVVVNTVATAPVP